VHRVILSLALFLTLAGPCQAQLTDTVAAADRMTIVARVLRARATELHDRVETDRIALARVLGPALAAEPEIVSLLDDPCGGGEGRWAIASIGFAGDGDVLVRADRVDSGGSARAETYRLRRTCAAAGPCAWWLVDIRLADFESNDVVPLPAAPRP
jgi:hypothetical protein